jgi:hypothetical protein
VWSTSHTSHAEVDLPVARPFRKEGVPEMRMGLEKMH